MRATPARLLALAATAGVAALGAGVAEPGSAQSALGGGRTSVTSLRSATVIDGAIRVDARFTTAARGTFRITGANSDTGSLAAKRRVSSSRLQLTETLTGKAGAVRIQATTKCSTGRGTWRVLSGSGAYAGLTGGGSASGGLRCRAAAYPARATYSGLVRMPPPPPLAQAGRFGGETSYRAEVTFDVLDGGRTFGALRLRVPTTCERTALTTTVIISLQGPYEIESDGSFSVTSSTSFSTSGVIGRFTSLTTAEGTATATAKLTSSATNTTYDCSGEVTWRASLPPPAATPGQYCGFTNLGPSICLDVAASGREVTRLEVGFVALCNGRTTEVEVMMVFTGIPIGGNLGFQKSSSALEGLISGMGSVSGLLDPNGGTGAHGSVSLRFPVFDLEGTRYTCGVGTAQWEARRQ